jgi:aryl-alcohol dehydrogenase-like predicted oxidoreductase
LAGFTRLDKAPGREAMRKVFFGRTGLEISELALGGGVTGGILINADEATRYNALRRAVMGGINWIDTAPIYGNGASEETIGRHLETLVPRPYVSTKVRLEADDMKDIAGGIERSLAASLTRLRLQKVDLFQLHNHIGEGVGGRQSVTPEQVLGPDGVADTFDRLKEQGLIHAGGITAAGDTKACLEVIQSGRFEAAQVYYNAINPSAAWSRVPLVWKGQDFCGIIAACFLQNMGVLNIRVWAGGALARAKPPDRLFIMTTVTDLDNEVRCAAAVRQALGNDYGTPAQAALRFALGNRDVASRVIGIADLKQLDEALEAVRQGPLPTAAISKLDELWANDFRPN